MKLLAISQKSGPYYWVKWAILRHNLHQIAKRFDIYCEAISAQQLHHALATLVSSQLKSNKKHVILSL